MKKHEVPLIQWPNETLRDYINVSRVFEYIVIYDSNFDKKNILVNQNMAGSV